MPDEVEEHRERGHVMVIHGECDNAAASEARLIVAPLCTEVVHPVVAEVVLVQHASHLPYWVSVPPCSGRDLLNDGLRFVRRVTTMTRRSRHSGVNKGKLKLLLAHAKMKWGVQLHIYFALCSCCEFAHLWAYGEPIRHATSIAVH